MMISTGGCNSGGIPKQKTSRTSAQERQEFMQFLGFTVPRSHA